MGDISYERLVPRINSMNETCSVGLYRYNFGLCVNTYKTYFLGGQHPQIPASHAFVVEIVGTGTSFKQNADN